MVTSTQITLLAVIANILLMIDFIIFLVDKYSFVYSRFSLTIMIDFGTNYLTNYSIIFSVYTQQRKPPLTLSPSLQFPNYWHLLSPSLPQVNFFLKLSSRWGWPLTVRLEDAQQGGIGAVLCLVTWPKWNTSSPFSTEL